TVCLFPVPPSSGISTLSLHDALPICLRVVVAQSQPTIHRRPLGCVPSSCHSALRMGGPGGLHRSLAGRPQSGRTPWSEAISSCRSEEHTSELQSRENLVCRLLLEKKK